LPDEILRHIVKQVAGRLRYGTGWHGYGRDPESNAGLRSLRLVNRRLSGIAQAELYRVPSTLRKYQYPLISDHLDILLLLPILATAQLLSLAGTPAFFARLLAARFLNLTSLSLVFKRSCTGFESDESDFLDLLGKKALTHLRHEKHPVNEDHSSRYRP
jgi:hypothetical protein